MSQIDHKQYLIDSVKEMESFCIKLAAKMEIVTNDMSYNAMHGVYSRKQKSIADFKELLRTRYNYTIN